MSHLHLIVSFLSSGPCPLFLYPRYPLKGVKLKFDQSAGGVETKKSQEPCSPEASLRYHEIIWRFFDRGPMCARFPRRPRSGAKIDG